jgi:two-component system, OmpR family, sensor histidine kinase KdpD
MTLGVTFMPGRGQLTTFLGTAPGVGKTYSMLREARRRAIEGERVVVGWYQDHDRRETMTQLADLETIPPVSVEYRGHSFAEMDTVAVQSARPDVVVVDELAHSWPDGSRKRWADVNELLEAGADVLTSVNVANLTSARDYVARITGAGSVESVPDDFVRSGRVILVDLPAAALRTRLSSGKVFSADQVGGALGQYFRVSNLEALSELGKAWLEVAVEEVGEDLLARRGIAPLRLRSTVIAGVSASPWGEAVILRAAQLACDEDSDLVVIHARIADAQAVRHPELLAYYRLLTEGLGGSYVDVDGDSPAQVLAQEAAGRPASKVVVARHRSGLREIVSGSVARQLHRLQPGLNVEEVKQRTVTPPTDVDPNRS